MIIEFISIILKEIGLMCLASACCITIYKIGIKTGRQDAIDDVKDLLRKNSDKNGICKIQTDMRI